MNDWHSLIGLDGEDTFVSDVRKLHGAIPVHLGRERSMEFHGYLYRHFNARDVSRFIVFIRARSTEGARGPTPRSILRVVRPQACASARPTGFYDDHVQRRVEREIASRIPGGKIAISITNTHIRLKCVSSFSLSPSARSHVNSRLAEDSLVARALC